MDKRLECTNCGGLVIITLRDRNPNGWQPYAQCMGCGARNWENQTSEPWASIRYVVATVATAEVVA